MTCQHTQTPSVMNQFLSSAFAAALMFTASVALAQPGTTFAELPHLTPTSHEYNAPVPTASKTAFSQATYTVQAVVIPESLVYRPEQERTLRASAATKQAAMTRIKQMIDGIGISVRVVSLEFIQTPNS